MEKNIDVNKLCMGCMGQLDENDTCPVCDWKPPSDTDVLHYLQPKTILNGKYIVGRVIGEGGFGITYLGWDLNLELKVAIKEYFPFGYVNRDTIRNTVMPYTSDKGNDYSRGLERFLDEARSLARFNQLPGIVSVRDFFTENGTAYIVMEYLEGMTFKDYIQSKGGTIPFSDLSALIKPVMESLAIIHAEGIVHRDISPDNLFITETGQIKLLDFGAARMWNVDEKSLSVVLKPGFAPEEQYRRTGIQGAWTDIYSLAVTIYKAITGQMPPESLERLTSDEILTPSALKVPIPPDAEAALMKALAVRADDRFQNIDDFIKTLFEEVPVTAVDIYRTKGITVVSKEPAEPTKTGTKERLILLIKKIISKPKKIALIVVPIVVLAILLGAYFGYIASSNNNGNKMLKAKKYPEAIKSFDKTLNVSKNNYAAIIGKGEALYEEKDYKDALAVHNKAVSLKPGKFDAYYEKSKDCIKLYEYEDALEAASKAVELNPNSPDALRCKAEALASMYKLDEAMKECEKALKIDSSLKEAYFLKGNILQITYKLSDAILSYNKALELDPGYVDAYNAKGNAYENMSKFDNAMTEYDKALEKDKNNFITKCNKAALLYFLGKAKDADNMFTDISTNLSVEDYESFIAKANAYYYMNKTDEAMVCIEKAIEINKWGIYAISFKAELQFDKDELDKAQKLYNEALQLYPNYYNAINGLGRVYTMQSKWDDADKMFEKTIEMLPDYYNNYIWKGWLMDKKGNTSEALNLYYKSINIYPTATPYELIGGIYNKQNKINESIAAYKKAVDLGSRSEDTIQTLGYLLIKVADYAAAKEYNLKYISQYGENEVVYGNLAYACEKLGEDQNALNYIEKALEYNQKDINYINFKLRVLLKLGRQTDAVDYAKSCIEKGYITTDQINVS